MKLFSTWQKHIIISEILLQIVQLLHISYQLVSIKKYVFISAIYVFLWLLQSQDHGILLGWKRVSVATCCKDLLEASPKKFSQVAQHLISQSCEYFQGGDFTVPVSEHQNVCSLSQTGIFLGATSVYSEKSLIPPYFYSTIESIL